MQKGTLQVVNLETKEKEENDSQEE